MQICARRRPIAALSAAALILAAVALTGTPHAEGLPAKDDAVAFFLIGDTHMLSDPLAPEKLDQRSERLARGLVHTLNRLPGTAIAKEAGGETVRTPRGVVHAGDVIDTGDRADGVRQRTEWLAFSREFGLTGKDGRLKAPIYEVHGNHDGPRGEGWAVRQIVERNKTRPGTTNVSENGLHYSWDWGNVHFVNLGIVVGKVDAVKRKRRYDPLGSLDFLISDLKKNVGDSRRPVVVTHHVDMLRYSQPLPVEDQKAESMEWDPADVKGFYDALEGYRVAAILYGHTHARNVFRWNGTAKAAKEGIPVFNVAKSSHFSGEAQALFYLEIRDDAVTAREYRTKDGWETGEWTQQKWSAPIVRVAPRAAE